MPEWPRVMVDILKEMVLFDQDTWWLKSKYLRRGRIVEYLATRIAQGNPVAEDDPWWQRGSGFPPDDPEHRHDPNDYLPHEECREYQIGVRAFLAEHDFVLNEHQLYVIHESEGYCGHLDWLGYFKHSPQFMWILDLKCGPPPQEWIRVENVVRRNPIHDAYCFQTALYKRALMTQITGIIKRAALHIWEGRYKFLPHDNHRDETTAVMLVRAYRIREQYRGIR